MKYSDIHNGVFISRPNRFIAHVLIDGQDTVCHVKNTGRCRELLIPGARVLVEKASPEAVRKTGYDLVSVYKGERLVNMDSQAPNRIFEEWIQSRADRVQREVVYGSSRLDFCLEKDGRRIYAEIKGVTLEKDNIAMFPDAPTERGIKHLRELQRAVGEGYGARVYFIIQMNGIRYFMPSYEHHPEFCTALREAGDSGVEIYALECDVREGEVKASSFVPVVIEENASLLEEVGLEKR